MISHLPGGYSFSERPVSTLEIPPPSSIPQPQSFAQVFGMVLGILGRSPTQRGIFLDQLHWRGKEEECVEGGQ